MRIFYASERSPNAFFASNLWRENLYGSLVDLGHDVIELDFDLAETFRNLDPADPAQKRFIDENRPRVSRALLEQLKAAHAKKPVDLLFTYFYDACILPSTLDEIRALGIKTMNWYCNASYQLHLVREISPHYDWCLVPEKFRLDDYRKMGARPIYCQEAANPKIYKPFDLAQDVPVSFIGQAYGERPRLVADLLSRGLDLRVWGQGWSRYSEPLPLKLARAAKRKLSNPGAPTGIDLGVRLPKRCVGGVLNDDELIKTYSRSKINLGFSTVGSTHADKNRITQIRLRDFEIPMAGGFYLVERIDDLAEYFELGKEIETYDTVDELVDKAKFYLANDSARDRIRRAGRERCLRDHTWKRRFDDAFREAGLVS